METTTIRVDLETKERLEELAAKTPLMRYLRELSISLSGKPRPLSPIERRLEAIEKILRLRENPSAGLEDLIVETRSLGVKLGYSEKRLKVLDVFLTKAEPETIVSINQNLKDQLANPEYYKSEKYLEDTIKEFQPFFTNHILPNLTDEQKLVLVKAIQDRLNEVDQ